MTCPKCGFVQPDGLECARCGIVMARFQRAGSGDRVRARPRDVPPPPRAHASRVGLVAAGALGIAAVVFALARPRPEPARGPAPAPTEAPVATLPASAPHEVAPSVPVNSEPPAATPGPVPAAATCPLGNATLPSSAQPSVSRDWHRGADGYERAEQERLQSGAPMLVYFHTDWCGYCRELERELLGTSEVERYLETRMIKVRVNPETGDAERALGDRFEIDGYPSLFVLGPDAAPEEITAYARGGGRRSELMTPGRFVRSLEEELASMAAQVVYEGQQRRGAGDLPGSLRLLDRALILDPASAEGYLQRGLVRTMTRELDLALGDLRRASELKPDEVRVYEGVEYALGGQSRWPEAAACWSELIDRAPDAARAYLRRGGSYLRAGDLTRALADAEKACSLGEAQGCALARRSKG